MMAEAASGKDGKRKVKKRRSQGRKKPDFRLVVHSSRPISVEFALLPGRRFSTGTRLKREAKAWAESFIASGRLEEAMKSGRRRIPTLGEYAKDFFIRTDASSYHTYNVRHNRTISDYGYRQRQDLYDNYVEPRFGDRRMDTITAREIDQWMTSLKGVVVHDLSDNTRNKILCTLRIVLGFAVYQGVLQNNPAEGVRPINERPKWLRRALSQKEQALLFPPDAQRRIEIWGSLMWALYFSILYDTGFRPGEVAGLSLSNIYKTSNGLAVSTSQSISWVTNEVQQRVKTTGHGVSERVGLLGDITAELLVEYIEANHDELKAQKDGSPLLLMDPNRAKHRYVNIAASNKRFKAVLKANGLEVCTQYCLRHTHMTELRGELSDRVLAISMGHVKLRDDYDHQKAEQLIGQLEASRSAIFDKGRRNGGIIPLKDLV